MKTYFSARISEHQQWIIVCSGSDVSLKAREYLKENNNHGF